MLHGTRDSSVQGVFSQNEESGWKRCISQDGPAALAADGYRASWLLGTECAEPRVIPSALPLLEKDFYLISNQNLPSFILKRNISRPCSPHRAAVRPPLPISLLRQHHLFMLKPLPPLNDKSSSSWLQRQKGCPGADRAHPSPPGLSPSLTRRIALGSSPLFAFSSLSLPLSSRQPH